MPDKRLHRGKHPEDDYLFNPANHQTLRKAVSDFSWLLSHGYADKSSLKLVGDRYNLCQRQRMAVMRCGCSDTDLQLRNDHLCDKESLKEQSVYIDGYNLITTIESALSGAVILKGRDGHYRDIAALHGTYRKVMETIPSIEIIGRALKQLGIYNAAWYLDRPVSNSRRLKTILLEISRQNHWNWDVQIVINPDTILSEIDGIVVTSDSIILNNCRKCYNLTSYILKILHREAFIVDLECLKV